MKPILFPADETEFTSNGLGRLQPLSCSVTEERNGQYELEMQLHITDRHYPDIETGRILLSRHDETDDLQPFEIYRITRPLNGIVTVLAHHISYRTAMITVTPFTAESCSDALQGLKAHSVGEHPFSFWTDKDVTSTYTLTYPRSLRSLLAGEEGSVLSVYGKAEYEWDRFNIRLHRNRGRDSGVTLRYGKDLTDLRSVTDCSDLWTGVVPFWKGMDDNPDEEVVVMLPEVVLYTTVAEDFAYKMVKPLDLSESFMEPPSVEELRIRAQQYINANARSTVPPSITVSFVNLPKDSRAAQLQQLRLCDTVRVVYDRLGVSNQAKIVRTVYDVLLERYSSMTLGNVVSSLAQTISATVQPSISAAVQAAAGSIRHAMGNMSDDMAAAISHATDMISGGEGGYVLLKRNHEGQPEEILIMDHDSTDQAVNVIRLNRNGIGFSTSGWQGPFTSAWTIDGRFVADFIQAGTLNADLIRAGTLQDANGRNIFDLVNGTLKVGTDTAYVGNQTLGNYTTGVAETRVSVEKTRAEGVESTLSTNITTEKNRAETAESAIRSRVTQTETDITSLVEKTGVSSLGSQETLYSKISQNASGLTSEVSRATSAEAGIMEDVDDVVTDVSVIQQKADAIGLTVSGIDLDAATGTDGIKSSKLEITKDKVEIKSSGAFIVDSSNFSVDVAGNVEMTGEINADSGRIGNLAITGSGFSTDNVVLEDTGGTTGGNFAVVRGGNPVLSATAATDSVQISNCGIYGNCTFVGGRILYTDPTTGISTDVTDHILHALTGLGSFSIDQSGWLVGSDATTGVRLTLAPGMVLITSQSGTTISSAFSAGPRGITTTAADCDSVKAKALLLYDSSTQNYVDVTAAVLALV